jgi:molecular chaperone GrpE
MATKAMEDDVGHTETTGEARNGEASNDEAKDSDLRSENAALRERLMRALAETENTRRQGERRTQDARQYAITNFARELLQVVDNLRRAIDAGAGRADTGNGGGLIDGVVATDRILAQILKRFGVEEIEALNAPFDPEKHEAVMEVDAAEQPPRSVVQVLENGYTLNDRLLRPARVAVAKSQQLSPQAGQQ